MMKSGNHKHDSSCIINVNARRNKLVVFTEWGLSIVLTIFLWIVLFQGIINQLLGERLQQTLRMMSFLFIVSVLIFLIMGGWQFYNWYRFHGKDRRKAFKQQPLREVAVLYGMSESEMERIQGNFRQASVRYQDGHYWYVLPGAQSVEIKSLREKNKKV